jgi:NADPH:quinone reductase-like Zn-dependent oxidoreductase
MQAVTITDKRLVIAQHPDPEPGSGEVLVRVRAAGLNGADMAQVQGHYPPPPGSPVDIPGMELAGEVTAVGPGVRGFAPGERVMGLVGGGAQAELAVIQERMLMPVPERLDWARAGGAPEVFTTAHDALFTQAELKPGERLLIHGGAGGVGTAAVQLGVSLGARVTASVRNPALREAVAAFGAEVIAPEEFVAHGPFDVILELVGAPNWPGNLKALAVGGRIAVIGVGAGAGIELNLGMLMGRRGRIHGSTLRGRPLEEKALATRAVERSVLPQLASGRIEVPLAETYPFTEAQTAYDHFRAGGKLGKIVLTF